MDITETTKTLHKFIIERDIILSNIRNLQAAIRHITAVLNNTSSDTPMFMSIRIVSLSVQLSDSNARRVLDLLELELCSAKDQLDEVENNIAKYLKV